MGFMLCSKMTVHHNIRWYVIHRQNEVKKKYKFH